MTRDETIALFNACEAARKTALSEGSDEDQAHEAARTTWNFWAEAMLAERKRLEDTGAWAAERDRFGNLVSGNEATAEWMKQSEADFSELQFLVKPGAHQAELQLVLRKQRIPRRLPTRSMSEAFGSTALFFLVQPVSGVRDSPAVTPPRLTEPNFGTGLGL